MCIIIDANVVSECHKLSQDAEPVIKWLYGGDGGLVVGGKLQEELAKTSFVQTMLVLDQAGKLIRYPTDKIEKISEEIKSGGLAKSDDEHVLALIKLSKCNVLYSGDQKLHVDAKNRDIIDHRVGIYQCKDHSHLLTKCKCDKG